MNIDRKLAKAFNKAVTNLENIHMGTQEGEVNWNFVDADIHMDLGIPYIDTLTAYNRQFNHLADCYLGNITLADRIADSTSMNCNIDVALKLDSSKPSYIIQTA
jgi:phage FluMu gp28-like protein